MDYLKFLDLYPYSPVLYLNHSSYKRSKFGAFISIILIILAIVHLR
jgi:hypothetical protein